MGGNNRRGGGLGWGWGEDGRLGWGGVWGEGGGGSRSGRRGGGAEAGLRVDNGIFVVKAVG